MSKVKTRALRLRKYGVNHYRGRGKLRGSGHAAGESWGDRKEIDPSSKVRKYSKNSPSFDEGVRNYKTRKYNQAISEAKVDKFFNK